MINKYHGFVAGPTAARVKGGSCVTRMVSCSLTVSLVTPGKLGVTAPVNASLGTASAVSHVLTGLQDGQLLLRVDQRSAGAV